MTELDFWLWLSLKKGINSVTITHLLELFDSPEKLYGMSKKDLLDSKMLTRRQVSILADKSMNAVMRVKERCKKYGIRIMTYDSAYYPEKLKHIPDPPYVLYVLSKKRINLNDRLCIAMVGNRIMTDYGRCSALDIAKGLSEAGIVVVSGMARGIDGASHAGVLRAGGTTVAVLGCGLDIAYPPEHNRLMRAICETGMVISEYPPGTPPKKQHFPVRNRIISGITDGVVVVEAPKKSGSLITAEYAYEQGRDVFAVPGDINRGHSQGTNDLIRQGATLVTSAFDILYSYEDKYRNTLKEYLREENLCAPENNLQEKTVVPDQSFDIPQDQRYQNLSLVAQKIVSNLSLRPIHFDQLLHQTDLSADNLSAELMMLEIGGVVKEMPGKNYILNA